MHWSRESKSPALATAMLRQHDAIRERRVLQAGVARGKRQMLPVGRKKAVAIVVRTSRSDGTGRGRTDGRPARRPVRKRGHFAAVMAHYSRIARELAERPDHYAPILGVDADSGAKDWEPRAVGLERAMRLRRAVWRRIVRSADREASESLNMIIAPSDSWRGRSDLTEEGEEKLGHLALEIIPDVVCKLHAWNKSRQAGEHDTGPAA